MNLVPALSSTLVVSISTCWLSKVSGLLPLTSTYPGKSIVPYYYVRYQILFSKQHGCLLCKKSQQNIGGIPQGTYACLPVNTSRECTIISKNAIYKRVSKALLSWSEEQVLFEHKKIVLNLNKTPHQNYWYYLSVFRIHGILRRIRILGSVHWITNRALDPDSASFCQWISRCQQKICFLSKVFLLIT